MIQTLHFADLMISVTHFEFGFLFFQLFDIDPGSSGIIHHQKSIIIIEIISLTFLYLYFPDLHLQHQVQSC